MAVRTYTGLTGDLARAEGACAIVRACATPPIFEYERTMEAANRRLFGELTTVVLFTPAEVADIASSTVRELLAFGRAVDEFMPAAYESKITYNTE